MLNIGINNCYFLGQETVGFSRFGEYLCSAILKSQILKNSIFFFLLFLSVSLTIQAKGDGPEIKSVEPDGASSKNESPYDPTEDIMHHISDSYGWHLFDWKGHSISVPLPVILFTEKGLVTFMSSSFHHDHEGKHVVEAQGYRFVNYHEKIYYASSSPNNHGAFVNVSKESHSIENKQPIDISITKNVASLLLSAILILWLFLSMARFYKKQDGHSSPKGVASFMEPIVVFVRDEIAKNNIGRHYDRFVPLLLTFFFFIWINNVLGLIPIFSWRRQLNWKYCCNYGIGFGGNGSN